MPVAAVADRLAEYVAGISYADLPPETIAAAKQAILDQMGIMVRGSTLPWTQPAYKLAARSACSPESTVVGHGIKVSALDAAMVNSNFGHACELDDTGHNGGVHAGAISVPTALAVCEARGLGGRDMILGVVVGYEILYRIGRVLTRPAAVAGFHAQSVVGPFGAAAIVTRLQECDSREIANAFSIAGSHASGTMEYDQGGGEVKRFHSAMAVRGGMTAAFLAVEGLTGPATIFEGPRGVVRMFGGSDAAQDILAESSEPAGTPSRGAP